MMIPRRFLPLLFTVMGGALPASNDSGNNEPQNDSGDHHRAVPVVKWTFEDAPAGTWAGSGRIGPQGPQAPTYPHFPKGNKAAYFPGKDVSLVLRETDLPEANLRFGHGEGITLEAWVNVEKLGNGKYSYLLGKGRNRNGSFEPENQNYALRLKGEGGEACISFLFRSVSPKVDSNKDYHRWTSEEGFAPGGWHHVAVTYTFGKPDSIAGFVDGKKVKGKWDMGGKTDRPPVNDADDLVIGTGNGGGAGNSFHGWLDEVAVYREVLPDALLTQRFQFVPPRPLVDVKKLPKGGVRVEICEAGVPEANAWPPLPPKATEVYREEVFGIFELPQKYVDTGVRGDRANPLVLRAAALVNLPPGKHRLLLRGRNASRLYVDGRQLLALPFMSADSGGHGHVAEQEKFLDLGPDFRFAPPGTQEVAGEIESKGKPQLVILEQLIGGMAGKNKRRPEPGEMVVAVSLQGSETWEILSPGARQVPYTDAGWAAFESERRAYLAQLNARRRAEVRGQQAPYWDQRREAGRRWLAQSPEVNVPALPQGFPALNPLDHFIAAKIAAVSAQNQASQGGTVDFFKDIQPILETKCLDCHKGAKVKGGLRLDTLADAMKGGKDDGPAVQPGRPGESALLKRVTSKDEDEIMPPKGNPLTPEQVAALTTWIKEGAHWPEMKVENTTMTALCDDLAFLRRAFLDTVGVPPSLEEIARFTKEQPLVATGSRDGSAPSPRGVNRPEVIDYLLADPRWADHWMGYWLDVLAENPNILNPTLNNTGPFRWWIYESLLDDKPADLFVTELLRMKGSERFGGPAGFGVASQNDVPMAAKGTIVSTAFLGVEMKCARCHDAPSHKSTQQDLFELAAMLQTAPLEVPKTSSVPLDKISAGGRKPLINVTLKPGTKVEPKWPFGEFCPEAVGAALAQDAKDPRDRLAALVTAPQNERFAQVMANRVWARFMGRGIVEPIADWEKGRATHPELLRWLGRELVRSGYSVKHLARLVMNSHAYQRATDPALRETSPLFVSPAPRRLGAEQIVDSLFATTGKPFRVEEVSLDIDGRRDLKSSISLGQPRRCWMLTSTSNERDRPSLALPRIQAVTDVLAAFGWRGARQDPTSKRETEPNALQPAILGNGTVGVWLTRLSDDHGITRLALQDRPLEKFVDTLFLKLLTRRPTDEERARYVEYLRAGYEARIGSPQPSGARQIARSDPKGEAGAAIQSEVRPEPSSARRPPKYVSWSNHLDSEATVVRQQQEIDARRGDAPTTRLDAGWRQRLEDVLWALLNAPEWVFAP